MTSARCDIGVHTPAAHVDPDTLQRLVGGHCQRCDLTAYPPAAQCPRCWGALMDRVLSPVGTLYSYSVLHIGTRSSAAPYAVGYVDLPEGARIFAHLDENDEAHLRPDMPVRLRLYRSGEGYRAVWAAEEEAEHA